MENNKKSKKEKKIYRLMVLEEKKYEPLFSLKLTKTNMAFYFGGLLFIIIVLSLMMWRYTPLKKLLPHYEDLSLKNKVLENKIKLDSLQRELLIRDYYFKKLRYIVLEKNIDSIATFDSSAISKKILSDNEYDSIMKLLEGTKNIDINIENQIADIDELSNIKFTKPVNGVISNKFNPSEGHFGIDIVAKEKTPVQAVLPGTVILATWTYNTGYVIEIQHDNNMISVYKHNSELLKKEGDKVKAGEAIALIGKSGELSSGPHLHFELWYNGQPVNPTDFIVF